MQPRVYNCDNVLGQGLLPGICRLSKWWLSVSAERGAGTPFMPHCHLAAVPCAWVHWTRKLATKQSVSKSCDLLSVAAMAQMLCRHKNSDIDQWPAETRANWLMGSAKPRHVKSSDRPVAKTDDGYQSQGCSCWITSGLTVCANDPCWFTVLWVKIE